MPNCFTLTRKSNPEAGPVEFTEIDEEMCRHFGVPCDPVQWYMKWYCFACEWGIALGATLKQLVDDWEDEHLLFDDEPSEFDIRWHEILVWLDENFTSDAWAEIGRR